LADTKERMSTQGSFEGEGGTLTGRAPAARIFALVVLSLVVLLGSLLAVRAIGQHDGNTPVSARPNADGRSDANGVLVVPKDEPKPKPKPQAKPQRKPQTTTRTPATSSSAPVQSSAASSSPAPATSTPAPTPAPAPAPAPTPAPAPAPAPKPQAQAAKKAAPVQHTVVVTQ
jgi:hypothetical protein